MNENEFKSAAKIIKSATMFTKKFPFYYAALYVVLMCAYLFCSEKVSEFIDLTFYVSPFVVFVSLRFSRIFKMCKWHRLECALPLIPYSVNLIDYVSQIRYCGAAINLSVICVLIVATIVNAYFVFRRSR